MDAIQLFETADPFDEACMSPDLPPGGGGDPRPDPPKPPNPAS